MKMLGKIISKTDMADRADTKQKREPLISISKRDGVSLGRSVLVRVAAILIAIAFSALITVVLTKQNPLKIFASMFNGNFGTANLTWEMLREVAILLCIGLALIPAFKMKFWNTGAEGQVLIGALATAFVMFNFGGKVPEWVLMIMMTLAAVIAGGIWGLIPAFCKAKWGTNETLFTLMMNYIAMQLIEYFLKVADKTGSNTVGPNVLTHGWFPSLFGQKYLLVLIITVVMTVFMYFYLNYSKHGYEISVVGESNNTAKYIGINVKTVIIRTMILSGALCGLVGLMLVGMMSHSIDPNIAGGDGFTAIMVAWLAKFNPFIMVLSSFLLVFLSRGASEVSMRQGLNASYSEMLTGIILFFIIGCEFFLNYKITFRKRKTATDVKEGE